MEMNSGKKINYIIQMILITIIIVLIILLIIQNRKIKELQKVNSTFHNASVMPSEKKSDNSHSGENIIADANDECRERIKNFELKIADMQSWQDYLEESIEKDNSEKAEKEEKSYQALKSSLTSQMEIFAEEYNIPENKITELIELLFEMDLETRSASKNTNNAENFQKERESIKLRYESMISELLSVKDYNAYKEYQDTMQDRRLVNNAKSDPISGDIQFDKQQEKNLIAAIYRKRLEIEEAEDLIKIRESKLL